MTDSVHVGENIIIKKLSNTEEFLIDLEISKAEKRENGTP